MIEVVNNNVSSVVGGARGILATKKKTYESIFNKSNAAKNFKTKNIKLWMKRVLDLSWSWISCYNVGEY